MFKTLKMVFLLTNTIQREQHYVSVSGLMSAVAKHGTIEF